MTSLSRRNFLRSSALSGASLVIAFHVPRRAEALPELQRAAQLFENSSGTSIESPGWGHAEAYLALGHELQIRGDHLGARNWTEKALIAAPDYKAAQRQLASLTKP